MSESNDDLPVFTVPRSKWYRGQDSDFSLLLRSDGLRCCLGHVGEQCGISDANMLQVSHPTDGPECVRPLWPSGLLDYGHARNSDVCFAMMRVNDDSALNESEREEKLQALAIEAGFRLVFTDEVTNG